MAALWIEGFDLFGSVSNVFRKYYGNTHGTLSLIAGRTTGQALKIHRTNDINIFTSYPFNAASTFILGFGLQVQGTLTTGRIVNFNMLDSVQVAIGITNTGRLQVFDAENNMLGQTNTGLVTSNNWNYVEIKVTPSQTGTGSIVLKLNNTQIINLTSISTRSSESAAASYPLKINSVSFLVNLSPLMDIVIDDVYGLDTVGERNIDFLGSVSVEGHLPAGDVVWANQWTAVGSATRWGAVNQSPADDDTTYIQTTSNNVGTYFTFPVLSGDENDRLFAVELNILGRKSGAGATKVSPSVYSGDTSMGSTPFPLTDQYLYGFVIYDDHPLGSQPWTISSYNNCVFGVSSNEV